MYLDANLIIIWNYNLKAILIEIIIIINTIM